jgi:NAD(P)H-dependent FMN reductase
MPTVLAISGSLRSKSFNTMLLHAVIESAPPGAKHRQRRFPQRDRAFARPVVYCLSRI